MQTSVERRNTSALIAHLRALRVMQAVGVHGSTVGAAEAIHLSQPAITRAINRLEEVCGQALFIRTTKGMRPTPQGDQLAQRIDVMFGHLETGAQEAMALDARKNARANAAERFAQSVTPSQIRALVAVADCGSESKAAQQLGVSQPAVYAALQELERLLGTGLFYKMPTGTRLTPPGEALLMRVKQTVAELRSMDGDIAAWHGETRGQIVIGTLPLSVPIFLPSAIRELMRQYPAVQVRVIDGTYENLLQHLLSADIDVIAGALRAGSPSAEVIQHELFEDDLVVIANRDHACFARDGITFRDLLEWPWVAPLPDTPADRVLRQVFMQHDLPEPSWQLSANSPMMTLAFVLQSGLLAIASKGQVLRNDYGGLVRIVPVELPPTKRRIGVATRAMTTPSPDLQAFLDICRRTVADLAP